MIQHQNYMTLNRSWVSELSAVPMPSLRTILFLAAAVRLAAIALVRNFLHPETWEFGPLANSLASGFGYSEVLANGVRVPSAFMPPGYPYFLSFFYRLAGDTAPRYLAIEIIQAACGVLLVYTVYRLASLLYGERLGRVAACLVAAYPAQIYMCTELHGISLYIVLGVAAVFFLARQHLSITHAWSDSVAAALCMGSLLLFRGEAPGLVLVYAAIILRLGGRKALFPAAAFIIISYGVLAPWTIRNYRQFHEFIPVCASAGLSLWVGNNPSATGSQHIKYGGQWWPPDVKLALSGIQPGAYQRIEADKALKDIAVDYIRAHPRREFSLALKKLWIFFVFDPTHEKGRNPVYWVPSLLVTILAAFGVWRRGKASLTSSDLFLIGSVAFAIAICMVLFTLPRYKIVVDPFFCVLASYAFAGSKSSETCSDGSSMSRCVSTKGKLINAGAPGVGRSAKLE